MVRALLSACLLLLSNDGAFAQEPLGGILPIKDGKVTYTGVSPRDSLTADQLYLYTRRWVVDQYKSGKDVTQMDDPANKEVIARGWFPALWNVTFYAPTEIQVWHTISIQCRDGRFKYEVTDFSIKWFVGAPYSTWYDSPIEEWNRAREKNVVKVYEQVHLKVAEMLRSLSDAIAEGAAEKDW